MTDEPQNTEETREDFEARQAAEAQKTEYVEFVGWPPFGTEFISEHSITAKHMKEVHDIDLGKKEVVWRKGTNGRFLVPTKDISPDTVAYLKTDPAFKIVSL